MNTETLFYALAELSLALMLGLAAVFAAVRLMAYWFTRNGNERPDNNAYWTLNAAVVFTVGYILCGSLQPITNCIRQLSQTYTGTSLAFKSALYVTLFVALGFVIAMMVNFATINLFNALTPDKDEINEIRQGHIGVALLTAAMLIVMSLLVQDSYRLLLEALIPYPPMPFN